MEYLVGQKGQIVIAREIRERLGVGPGWLALQRQVADHVEVYFVPPKHKKSLKGVLAGHIRVQVSPGPEWAQARETAWSKAAEDEAEAASKSR